MSKLQAQYFGIKPGSAFPLKGNATLHVSNFELDANEKVLVNSRIDSQPEEKRKLGEVLALIRSGKEPDASQPEPTVLDEKKKRGRPKKVIAEVKPEPTVDPPKPEKAIRTKEKKKTPAAVKPEPTVIPVKPKREHKPRKNELSDAMKIKVSKGLTYDLPGYGLVTITGYAKPESGKGKLVKFTDASGTEHAMGMWTFRKALAHETPAPESEPVQEQAPTHTPAPARKQNFWQWLWD
ncbi:MAG: hypothetical protein ABL951_04170 [Alphaproteobacteria bacterium]